MVSVDGYPLDLVESEQHALTAEVTKHPVEGGSAITDHVIKNPRELTLTNGVVSDTPIGTIALDATRTIFSTGGRPSRYAYERLEQIYERADIVTVITGLKKYDNMILDNLSVPQTVKDFGGLVFTAHFTQINIQNNRRVTVAIPNTRGAGAKKPNLGSKTSAAWGKRVGIAGSIFVTSYRSGQAASLKASLGDPILTDGTAPHPNMSPGFWNHYEVQGDTQPDGYVKAGVYYPMAYGGSVIPKDQFGNPIQHSKIKDAPVHYDYSDQQWHDDRDNSVVKVPPGGNDPWNTVTEEGPDANAQQGHG